MNTTSDMLLSTKLKIPAPRRDYVVRRALFDKLALCSDMSVIFVRGGAGTGKTTLLSSFIRETGLKNVGWISLDATYSNVYSFWHYFSAAANIFLKDDGSFLELISSNFDVSNLENLLTILINRLCGAEDYYIVLDDVHCISDPALTRTLEFFIRSMPENLHLFMLSREDPPVYLGPLAVSGRLLFIDGQQMQLSPEDGITFLKQTLKLNDSDEEISRLNSYAEGWIGGLQLAAAAKATGKYAGALLRAGGGIAAEYLTREIFESLTQPERDFLVGTGFLAYFDSDICRYMFDGFTRSDFDNMIENLTKKNLFVICIDEKNGVYRYHNILSEYLTQQFTHLTPDMKNDLLYRSAAAFEKRGDPEEALRQLCEANDYENVLRVARTMGGSIESWSYLNKVPLDLLIKDADLAVQCFMFNYGNLDIERCRLFFEKFRENYSGTEIFKVMQFADSYLSKDNSILPEYHTLTAEQIDSLNFGPVAKAMILVENATSLTEHMQYEEAEACLNKAIKTSAGANIFVDFFAIGQKAQLYEEIGRLNESLECYAEAMRILTSPVMLSGIGVNSYFGLIGVYMRRMELDKADETLMKAQHILEEQHGKFDVIDMTLLYHLAEMEFLRGEDQKGADYVKRIIAQYPKYSILTLGRLIHELDCAGLLENSLAIRFVEELEATDYLKIQPFMKLLHARLIFKKGEIDEAFKELEEVLVFSREHKNYLRLVEAGLLKIRMLLEYSDLSCGSRDINNLLRETIYYAHENRIIMPFFLDRKVFLPMLLELASKTSSKSGLSSSEINFVHDVIFACGDAGNQKTRDQEILSARELEVLTELAEGITNREIAENLCISQATVKTHVLSIYGKLGVSTRMMAVDVGRKKGLISKKNI